MKEHTFQLPKDQEYIQLNNLLKLLQIAQTGGHAKLLIQNNEVTLNGEIENRIRKKLVRLDRIEVADHIITIK